jgi:acyl carrier protein
MLDSFDLVSMVSDLNEEFDITIRVENLQPENFNSLEAIKALVTQLQDED